ncbi:MAG: glycine cleavage system aminomethyltransferase GcvT [Rhodospirillales bacterium]|nr:glycine cleavage system aminomethyltransferase GcvT [Rhodospirillales bacterium]
MSGGTSLTTHLHELHVSLGARMVPFAGYDMPVQYTGIIAEHLHTRSGAGLFDVGHMGQGRLTGAGAAAALETLVPGDITGLAEGRMRYTQLTNEHGGILDDLMVSKISDAIFLVVNASRKESDFAHIAEGVGSDAALEILADRALIALQGPKAAAVLGRHVRGVAEMKFMTISAVDVMGAECLVSRSGYTGEDGYEISIPGESAVEIAKALLAESEVEPIGLGARDTLRLEAGLCLYGNDIDDTTTPVEAGLTWSIAKRHEEGGFPGAPVIQQQIADGPERRRVGLKPDGKAPVRAHAEIRGKLGETVGEVTSGGFGPTVDGPVAMGYVKSEHAGAGTPVDIMVRGKPLPATVVRLPFVEQRYFRG